MVNQRSDFLTELESRIARLCRLSHEGFKSSPVDRHRLEGFIQAGVFLGLTTNTEAQALLERMYREITGKPFGEAVAGFVDWSGDANSYEHYEAPAYLRNR